MRLALDLGCDGCARGYVAHWLGECEYAPVCEAPDYTAALEDYGAGSFGDSACIIRWVEMVERDELLFYFGYPARSDLDLSV